MKKAFAALFVVLLLLPFLPVKSFAATTAPQLDIRGHSASAVRGLTEQLGVNYSNQLQLDRTIQHLNGLSDSGNANAQSLINYVNGLPATTDSNGNYHYVWQPNDLKTYLPALVQAVSDVGSAIGDIVDGNHKVLVPKQTAPIVFYGNQGQVQLAENNVKVLSNSILHFYVYDTKNVFVYAYQLGGGSCHQDLYILKSFGSASLVNNVPTVRAFYTDSWNTCTNLNAWNSPTNVTLDIPVTGLDVAAFNGIGSFNYLPTSSNEVPTVNNVPSNVWTETINNISNPVETVITDSYNSDFSKPTNTPLNPTVIDNWYAVSPPASGGTVPTALTDDTHSLLGYVADMYNSISTFFTSSVSTMQGLITGSAGLVSFIGTFFSWLPKQMVDLMSVGFMLGFIGYWFRR